MNHITPITESKLYALSFMQNVCPILARKSQDLESFEYEKLLLNEVTHRTLYAGAGYIFSDIFSNKYADIFLTTPHDIHVLIDSAVSEVLRDMGEYYSQYNVGKPIPEVYLESHAGLYASILHTSLESGYLLQEFLDTIDDKMFSSEGLEVLTVVLNLFVNSLSETTEASEIFTNLRMHYVSE